MKLVKCTTNGYKKVKYEKLINNLGKVYEIQNGSVKMSDGKYSKNDYTISFDQKVVIHELPEDNQISQESKLQFTKINKVLLKPVGSIVDVIGIVLVIFNCLY